MRVLGRGLAAGNGEQLLCRENFWINRKNRTSHHHHHCHHHSKTTKVESSETHSPKRRRNSTDWSFIPGAAAPEICKWPRQLFSFSIVASQTFKPSSDDWRAPKKWGLHLFPCLEPFPLAFQLPGGLGIEAYNSLFCLLKQMGWDFCYVYIYIYALIWKTLHWETTQ